MAGDPAHRQSSIVMLLISEILIDELHACVEQQANRTVSFAVPSCQSLRLHDTSRHLNLAIYSGSRQQEINNTFSPIKKGSEYGIIISINEGVYTIKWMHPDPQVARRVRDLFPVSSLGDRAAVVARYQASLSLQGDRGRGKMLFKKNCSACHQLEGVGTPVGAELNGVRNQGAATLLLNVLDPNRAVKPKFLNYVVQTRDGRVLSGLVRGESANTITVRQPDGKEITVQRVEIEAMRGTRLSFMPEGLEKQFDFQAMADLLEYLVPGK